jgi:hypothetical protein
MLLKRMLLIAEKTKVKDGDPPSQKVKLAGTPTFCYRLPGSGPGGVYPAYHGRL